VSLGERRKRIGFLEFLKTLPLCLPFPKDPSSFLDPPLSQAENLSFVFGV